MAAAPAAIFMFNCPASATLTLLLKSLQQFFCFASVQFVPAQMQCEVWKNKPVELILKSFKSFDKQKQLYIFSKESETIIET